MSAERKPATESVDVIVDETAFGEVQHSQHVLAESLADRWQLESAMPEPAAPLMTWGEASFWMLFILGGALLFIAGAVTHFFPLYVLGFVGALVGLVALMFGITHLIESRDK